MTVDEQMIFAFWTAIPFVFTGDYMAGFLWLQVFHYVIAQATYDPEIVYFLFAFTYIIMYITRRLLPWEGVK